MNTYQILLSTHALLRWVVVLAALYALYRSYSGWLNKKPFDSGDNFAGLLFTASVHFQAIIGLVLYIFVSPFTKQAFQDFGAAMKDAAMRYWAVEHLALNLLAVILITIGRSRSKRAADDTRKHKTAAIFYTIGVLLVLIALVTMKTRSGFRLMP